MRSAVETHDHYASALERATGKSAQRIIPTQGQLGTFDHPAHELRLIHVGSKRGHQAHMRRVLHEDTQGRLVLPSRERPEPLGEWPGENRIAEQTLSRCQLLRNLCCVEEERRHSPIALQWEVSEQ